MQSNDFSQCLSLEFELCGLLPNLAAKKHTRLHLLLVQLHLFLSVGIPLWEAMPAEVGEQVTASSATIEHD